MNDAMKNLTNDVARILIKNLSDLIDFRDRVNSGEDFKNKEVVQLCSFEELKEWFPIGTMEHPFRGTYAGQNEVFKKVTVQTDGVAGLFGCIERATIEDVCIEGGDIEGNKVGGICGHIRFSGNIRRCTNKANVKGIGVNAYAGGVCGDSWGGVFVDCVNNGNIGNTSQTASAVTGGIAGTSGGGSIEKCTNNGRIYPVGGHSGGICGSNNKGVIRDCGNEGMVESGKNKGGICGWNSGEVIKCRLIQNIPFIGDGNAATE